MHLVNYHGFYEVNGHKQIDKDPGDCLRIKFDLDSTEDGGPWLQEDEFIAGTPEWTVDQGLEKMSQEDTPTTSTACFDGGNLGDVYEVKFVATTNMGNPPNKTTRRFRVRMVER